MYPKIKNVDAKDDYLLIGGRKRETDQKKPTNWIKFTHSHAPSSVSTSF
jgi:hypothetical protein